LQRCQKKKNYKTLTLGGLEDCHIATFSLLATFIDPNYEQLGGALVG